MAANLTEILDSLPNSNDKYASLLDIKVLLGSLPPQSVRDVVQNVSFHVIFEYWNSSESDTVEVCCEVLQKLMGSLTVSVLLHDFHGELMKGLGHSKDPVKLLSLSQLLRCAEDAIDELRNYTDIIQQVTKLLADKSLYVAKKAQEVILSMGKQNVGLGLIFGNCMGETLRGVAASSDSIRFRVYELVVELGRQSPRGLQGASTAGWLHQLVNEVNKDDILVQLNGIELLSDLAMTEHGLMYLDQQGVLARLETMMANVESDPMGGLLLPGLIKFFGGMAKLQPKEVLKQDTFVNAVFGNLSSGDPSMRTLTIDTIGFIGASVEGKMALEKLGQRMNNGMKEIGNAIQMSTSEIRNRALLATSSIVRLKVEDQTVDLLSLTENWFGQLGPKPFETVMGVAKQPFTDLRCSAYQVIAALAHQPWGQRLMNEFPTFNEYLLDRSTDNVKEGKDSKFEIVKVLAESPTAADIFSQPFYVKLKALYLQGPFFMDAHSEVAFEGDT